jgi:hypothetical protein
MPVNTWGVNQNLAKGDVLETQNSGRAGTTRNIEVTIDDTMTREQVMKALQLIEQRVTESRLFTR